MRGDRVRFAGGAVTVLVQPICVAAATPAQTLRLLYQTLEHFRWLSITELGVVRPSFVLNAGLCPSFGYSKVKKIWSVTSLHWSLISVSRR
jgi:predicted acyltransferase